MTTNTVGEFLNAGTASSVGVAACVRCHNYWLCTCVKPITIIFQQKSCYMTQTKISCFHMETG